MGHHLSGDCLICVTGGWATVRRTWNHLGGLKCDCKSALSYAWSKFRCLWGLDNCVENKTKESVGRFVQLKSTCLLESNSNAKCLKPLHGPEATERVRISPHSSGKVYRII